MGLFGKKNNVAKQVADNEKQKQKQATKKTRPSGKSLYSVLVMPVIVVLVVFVLVGVGQHFLFVKGVEESFVSRDQEYASNTILVRLNEFVSERESWSKKLASEPLLIASLSDPSLLSVVSNASKAAWEDLTSIKTISSDQMNRIQSVYPDLSFASIDLIRAVSKGQGRRLEAFREGDSWFLQHASQLLSEDGKLQGILFSKFNLSALKGALTLPLDLNGQVELKTDLSASLPIVKLGNTQGVFTDDSPMGNGWYLSVSVQQDEGLLAPEQVLFWIILGAGTLVSALAIVLVIRLQMLRFRTDLIRATAIMKSILTGEGKKSGEIHYSEVNSVVLSLKSLLKGSARSKAGTPDENNQSNAVASEAAAQPTLVSDMPGAESPEPDAPLFDDDLLDLDILGEADASLAQSENEENMVTEVNQLDLDVPQSIFRAYDIRGIVDETLNEGVVELIGKAFATEALLQGKSAVCVGYDGRLSSETYCDALTRGIVSTGADAIVIGQVPTPVLYFSTHQLETGTGVMITGSHNPSNYNGFKMMIAGKTLANDDIQGLYNRIVLQDFKEGLGARTEQQVSRMYLDTILNDIAVAAPLKVVVDAGNGVAGELGPALVEELGCEVVPLFCEIDGTFPNHHPDPGKPKNLQDLIAAVKEHDADIGLAFDGDGDRVGVVTNTGKIIWPDRLLMLFAKDVVSRNPGADVIFDVKCSRRLNGLISGYGGRPIMWKTGHSLIKSKMKETGALLAGEMSGHIFFKERWFGFDDGLYSAARLLEILGVEDRTSEDVFEDFPEDVSTPEINIEVTDENKFDIVDRLCARASEFTDGNPSTIDGLRVDYQNGWGLCRASNTTPMLVLRFEADNENALSEIKEKFKAQLAQVDNSLDLDF